MLKETGPGNIRNRDGPMSPSTNTEAKTATAIARRARSLARSVAITNVFFLKQIWAWPIFAAIGLAAIGYYLRGAIEDTLRDQLKGQLQTIVDADVTALKNWAVFQKAIVRENAADDDVVESIQMMRRLNAGKKLTQLDLLKSPELQRIRTALADILAAYGFDGFMVIDDGGLVLAAQQNEIIGMVITEQDKLDLYQRVRRGEVVISPPYKSYGILLTRATES